MTKMNTGLTEKDRKEIFDSMFGDFNSILNERKNREKEIQRETVRKINKDLYFEKEMNELYDQMFGDLMDKIDKRNK